MLKKDILVEYKLKFEKNYYPSEDYRLWSQLVWRTKLNILPNLLCAYRTYSYNTSNRNKINQKIKSEIVRLKLIKRCYGFDFVIKNQNNINTLVANPRQKYTKTIIEKIAKKINDNIMECKKKSKQNVLTVERYNLLLSELRDYLFKVLVYSNNIRLIINIYKYSFMEEINFGIITKLYCIIICLLKNILK